MSAAACSAAASSSSSATSSATTSEASTASTSEAGVSSGRTSVAASGVAVPSVLRRWARVRLRSTRSRRDCADVPARRRPAADCACWRFWMTSRRSSLSRATTTVMWHVRLRMRVARPRARGRKRRSVGPSSAKQARTNSSSASCSSLCTALATALASTLRMSWATSRVVNCRISSARRTSRPRIRSRTSRALEAEPRRYLAVALVIGRSSSINRAPSLSFGPVTLPPFGRSCEPPGARRPSNVLA